MKTTVEIGDRILARAKKLAAARGVPLRSVMETALQQYIRQAAPAAKGFRLEDRSFTGHGLQPGVDLGDWPAMRGVIYEGRGARATRSCERTLTRAR